ncbi:MAG: hypothetical protein ACP5OB_08645 [Candidatus Ratteibacteria bacterium]
MNFHEPILQEIEILKKKIFGMADDFRFEIFKNILLNHGKLLSQLF